MNRKLIYREGELRLCKKVGNEKEEVILDTRKDLKSDSTAEVIKEEVTENVNTNELPEVKLSEEDKRKSIKFSDNIEFRYSVCLINYSLFSLFLPLKIRFLFYQHSYNILLSLNSSLYPLFHMSCLKYCRFRS